MADGTVRCIDSEIPFDIPDSWEWVRLGSIFSIWSARRVHEKDWRSSGIPFYRAREIGKLADNGVVDNDLFIERSLYNEFGKNGLPNIGDLMMTAVGTLGKVYVVDSNAPFYFKDGSVLCIGNQFKLIPSYLKLFFESSTFSNQYILESDGTTVATLTMVRLNKYLIPVPPITEQQRISNCLDLLRPLVYKYQEEHDALLRLNCNIFEFFKKSILQEAIQGRLVPQIASEGTAEELLTEIQAEKERLVKEGKLKKSAIANESRIFRGEDNRYYEQIGNSTIDITDLLLFDIPQNWRWCRLSNVIQLLSGRDLEPNEYNDTHKGLPYMTGASNFSSEELLVNRWTENPVTISIKGDLLITCKGTIGQMAFNTIGEIHIARQIMAIRGSKINLHYLKYFLEAMIRNLQKQAKSMIPGISREVLLNALFPLPPIAEQNRIIERIDGLLNHMKQG